MAIHSEIEEAHGIIKRHDSQMTAAKSDYNQLGEKYDDEVSYQQHVKDKLTHAENEIACLKDRVHNLVSTVMRSSSSSTKRKVDSPHPSH